MEKNTFIPPPEAPVFEPTEEEFQDPLSFIDKIRPYVEKTGICKIRPPPDWQPPFSVDVEKFRFTPRVQKLNELEATTRVKFNFLDAIAKFWELQGTSLKIPMVDRRNLDIFKLYKTVHNEGGYEYVTRKRKWPIIARKMDYLESKSAPTVLRNHYEKLLFPYDVFQSGLMTGGDPNHRSKPRKSSYRSTSESSAGNKRKSVRRIREEQLDSIDYKTNPALKKLQFRAPGPKMAAMYEPEQTKQEDGNPECCLPEKLEEAVVKLEPAETPDEDSFADPKPADDAGKLARRSRPVRRASKKILQDSNPELFQDEYVCHMCSQGDDEQYLLLCDGCDASFHTYCLIPPITTIPKGEWRCPKCIAQEYDKPYEIYGFEQSKKEYNLQSFGEMADKFKFDYFKLPPQTVPCDVTEREFWKLVSSVDEEVAIEYGADLHTAVHGSGFPVKENVTNADEEFYAKSKWNLNNLPTLPNSVLSHVNGNISGMKVPWMYVGMCFSSFCWHTEDHWSYSINYLHWGEPKTWYGIPGSFAEKFESVVQEMAPELFEAHPDLLHHLVTIVNPNVLMSKGVPVVRTNQEAGEFVVTFPRSYHAGFNQGYNLAEAVNFATADWLSVGHKCVDHYRRMNRNIVFSHDELICKMAANPENLDLNLAKAIFKDMESIVDEEGKLREGLEEKGITEAVRETFELLPDDERQCIVCNTTCFLSAVTCQCIDKKLSCIRCAAEHCNECEPQDHLLRHRYTLEELNDMLTELKRRADSFDNWANEVRHALQASSNAKVPLSSLKELVTTAEQSNFPDCELLEELKSAMAEAERCGSVATQLVTKKHRTRNTDVLNSNSASPSLNIEELQAFSRQLERLPCVIDQAELVQDLMNRVESFQSEARTLLAEPEPEEYKLKQLLDTGLALDVDLLEIPKLKQELHQCRWIQRVRETLEDTQQMSLDMLKALLDEASRLTKKKVVETNVKQLLNLVNTCEEWELKAKVCLQARPRHLMSSVQAIVREASLVPVYLPNISALKEALVKAHDWSSKVDHVQNDEHYPYLEVLEALVMRGRPIPVRLEQLPQMESQVAAAQAWRDRTSRTFLKKNSNFSLLETLTSRKDIGVYKVFGKQRKRKDKEREKEKEVIDLSSLEEYIGREPDTQSAAFREAKRKELQEIRELRKKNMARLVDLADQQPESRQFCVCRKGPDGYMLQCELCKEWFHGACVPLPRTPGGKGASKATSATTSTNETSRTLKYMCPLCYRSRRPRLETILSLLVSLQKLPVRLAEGEALQSLTECAMNWQDRIRQLLVKGNIAKVWRKISVEDALKEPASLQPPVAPVVSTATLLQQNMALVLSRQTQKTLLGAHVTTTQASSAPSSVLATSSENGGSNMDIDVVGTSGQDGGSNGIAGGDEGSPKLEESENREDAMEVEDGTKLSQTEFEELEELMMEGDTLEVTLDEADSLWKMVLNQRKHGGEKAQLLTPKKVDKEKKKRKRKKNEENPKSANEKDDAIGAGEKLKRKRSKKLGEAGKNEKNGEKKPRKYGRGRTKQQEDIVDVEGDDDDDDDDDDDEEEEEACLARPCKRPSSDEVDWVQCDTCEQWYHNLCVGITAKKATELDSYVCPYCKIPPLSTAGEGPILEIPSTATSPDSNIDVVSTTPCTTTPQSPRSPTAKQNTGSDVKLDQPMPELPTVFPASATQPPLAEYPTSEVKEPIAVAIVKE